MINPSMLLESFTFMCGQVEGVKETLRFALNKSPSLGNHVLSHIDNYEETIFSNNPSKKEIPILDTCFGCHRNLPGPAQRKLACC